MSKLGSRSNFSAMRSGLYETETQRLQREADTFTKKLEQEKRYITKKILKKSKKKPHFPLKTQIPTKPLQKGL
jgi:hypothetical protein